MGSEDATASSKSKVNLSTVIPSTNLYYFSRIVVVELTIFLKFSLLNRTVRKEPNLQILHLYSFDLQGI